MFSFLHAWSSFNGVPPIYCADCDQYSAVSLPILRASRLLEKGWEGYSGEWRKLYKYQSNGMNISKICCLKKGPKILCPVVHHVPHQNWHIRAKPIKIHDFRQASKKSLKAWVSQKMSAVSVASSPLDGSRSRQNLQRFLTSWLAPNTSTKWSSIEISIQLRRRSDDGSLHVSDFNKQKWNLTACQHSKWSFHGQFSIRSAVIPSHPSPGCRVW